MPGSSSFDSFDLTVGLILAVFIPIFVVLFLAVLELPLFPSTEVSENVELQVPPTWEDLQQVHQLSTNVLEESARFYMDQFRSEKNERAQMDWALWARRSLEKSRDGYDHIRKVLQSRPGTQPEEQAFLQQVNQRLSEVSSHWQELEDGCPLGLPR